MSSSESTTNLSHKTRQLVIEYRRIEELKPNPANPRVHTIKQIRQLAESIRIFHFNQPILVDRNHRIIAGHGRLEACKILGMVEVPTILIEHLTEAQTRAFVIADNKLTENAKWDEELLGRQLKSLLEVDLDFSVEVTGFEMGEIDFLVEGLEPPSDGASDQADEIPSGAVEVQVSRAGDLWLLGPHRIYCGNALEQDSFSTLMDGRKAAAVFADPPYNVKINGHVGGLGKIQHREFAMASGEMSQEEFTNFLKSAFRLVAANSTDGSLHYLCMDWRHLEEVLAAGKAVYEELKALCVWNKGTGGMGSLYRSQHELILVYKNGKASHRNNIELGRFGRYRTNVWDYPGANSFSRSTEEGNLLALHPTTKPAAFVGDAILDCTARGEVVLDPFLGSGTTVVASERVGRACCGLELDPLYVDTAIRRWQALTGKTAVHADLGRSFLDLEQEAING